MDKYHKTKPNDRVQRQRPPIRQWLNSYKFTQFYIKFFIMSLHIYIQMDVMTDWFEPEPKF